MNRDAVYNQLKIDEGVKYEIYKDHLGYPTFGVGHLITEDDPEYREPIGAPITEDRVRACFERDLDTAVSECKVLYGERDFDRLPDEVQQILVNMMFNMGRPRLSGFKKFNAAIGSFDWTTAAVEGRDSRWHKQVGDRAERLMVRLEILASGA